MPSGGRRFVSPSGCSRRGFLVGAGDHPFLPHAAKDVRPARERGFGLLERIHAPRRADQAGEERRLGKRQGHRLASEERLRGGRDPVRAGAEVGPVEIHGEDLALAVLAFQAQGDARLGELDLEGALAVREVHELRELLRDRRAALDRLALRPIGQRRARDGLGVDARVLPEAGVLDGDDRVLDDLRDVGGSDRRPVLLEERREEGSV